MFYPSYSFTLPYPPSVNKLYSRGRGGKQLRLSKTHKDFRKNVKTVLASEITSDYLRGHICKGKIGIHIMAHMPDRRKRDLDNLLKPTIDALQAANVFADDSQIHKITAEKKGVCKDAPRLDVKLYNYDAYAGRSSTWTEEECLEVQSYIIYYMTTTYYNNDLYNDEISWVMDSFAEIVDEMVKDGKLQKDTDVFREGEHFEDIYSETLNDLIHELKGSPCDGDCSSFCCNCNNPDEDE